VDIVKGINFFYADALVTVGMVIALMSVYLMRSQRAALATVFALMTSGMGLIAVATWLHEVGVLDSFLWYVGVGLGLFLAYVPFNAMLFERLMAFTRSVGTAVFAIQLADAAGYTASYAVQLYKDLGHPKIDRYSFFIVFSYVMSILGTVGLLAGAAFFLTRKTVASTRT
jgi:hypothetical protein